MSPKVASGYRLIHLQLRLFNNQPLHLYINIFFKNNSILENRRTKTRLPPKVIEMTFGTTLIFLINTFEYTARAPMDVLVYGTCPTQSLSLQ